MFVVEPRLQRAFALPRGADEDRAEVDLGKVQPLLERVDRAGLLRRAKPDLDLAPSGLGVEGEQRALVKDLDPAATGLQRADLRKRGDALRLACLRALIWSAREAMRLAPDVARRSTHLKAVAPVLRAKGAEAAGCWQFGKLLIYDPV